MPICLCDAEVYVVENIEDLNRKYAPSFLNGHVEDY